MIVNQANLHGLAVGYSTAYNKSFEATQSNYQKIATTVPSTTGEQDYKARTDASNEGVDWREGSTEPCSI